LKIVYVPVFRAAISYAVTLGRRWSLLDHMLLVELASARRSLAELSIAADLPERVVIESLINLLRAGWIEVRSDSDKANFAATPVGKRRATDKELQPELRREVKWTSLCMERLTGRWMRADDLELIYQDELPDGASTLEPVVSSLNYDDPDVRELINLSSDEGFDGFQPASKPPSRPFATVVISHGQVTRGLPPGSSIGMLEAITLAAGDFPEEAHHDERNGPEKAMDQGIARCEIRPDDVVAGGPEHLLLLRSCLASARTHIVVHSCFLNRAPAAAGPGPGRGEERPCRPALGIAGRCGGDRPGEALVRNACGTRAPGCPGERKGALIHLVLEVPRKAHRVRRT
jgi:hypothetical protein